MKAHKFKSKLTTREEVWGEFISELKPMIDKAIWDKVGRGEGVLKYEEFKQSQEGVRLVARIKLNLIKTWEKRGRRMAFLEDNPNYNWLHLLKVSLLGNRNDLPNP